MTDDATQALRLAAMCITDATELLPALVASDMAQAGLIERCQHAMAEYLRPGGYSKNELIHVLLGLLDGPEQRDILALHQRAVALVKGEIR